VKEVLFQIGLYGGMGASLEALEVFHSLAANEGKK
jgi:hypothetical protein